MTGRQEIESKESNGREAKSMLKVVEASQYMYSFVKRVVAAAVKHNSGDRRGTKDKAAGIAWLLAEATQST